jgi:hypothetical protein
MRSKLECLSLGESSTLVQCLLVSVRGHTLENSNLVSYFLAVKYETRLDVSFKDKTHQLIRQKRKDEMFYRA